MPENAAGIVIFSLFTGIGIAASVSCIVRMVRNRFPPIKKAKAVVIDKHKTDVFSKYSGNAKREKYVVVFSADGKKLSFYVPEFSYDGYTVNDKGVLRYRGDKLIDFQ